jgi:cell division septal protein FtsQ
MSNGDNPNNVVQIPRWMLGVALSVVGALLLMFVAVLGVIGMKVWESSDSSSKETIRLQGDVKVMSGQIDALRMQQIGFENRLEGVEDRLNRKE